MLISRRCRRRKREDLFRLIAGVMFGVSLGGFFGVVLGVRRVAGGDLGVMGGLLDRAAFVVLGGLVMMFRSLFMVLGGLRVVFRNLRASPNFEATRNYRIGM
jgi:hypothetical protein